MDKAQFNLMIKNLKKKKADSTAMAVKPNATVIAIPKTSKKTTKKKAAAKTPTKKVATKKKTTKNTFGKGLNQFKGC
ncbi:MAG TPA: hypothetical protein VIK72_19245 [Clostridiaceae bacterium]